MEYCHFQVTAAGKLYNVVVDTENTGKQLLQNGNLRRRVTIIPLNKIQSYSVSSRVQQAAVRLVGLCNFFVIYLSTYFLLSLAAKIFVTFISGGQGECWNSSFFGWLWRRIAGVPFWISIFIIMQWYLMHGYWKHFPYQLKVLIFFSSFDLHFILLSICLDQLSGNFGSQILGFILL